MAPHRRPRDENDGYRAVVCDLVSLVERVQSSLRLVEQLIAGETSPGSSESSANIIVLDDVSPALREDRRRSAGLRRQSRHCAALAAGQRRWPSLWRKPAGAFGYRGLMPTRT